MKFEAALVLAKDGTKIQRSGWNGQDQWVTAQYPGTFSMMTEPYLYLKNAQDKLVPWVPSQGDIFAQDWRVL